MVQSLMIVQEYNSVITSQLHISSVCNNHKNIFLTFPKRQIPLRIFATKFLVFGKVRNFPYFSEFFSFFRASRWHGMIDNNNVPFPYDDVNQQFRIRF